MIGGTSISVDIAVGLCSERRFTFLKLSDFLKNSDFLKLSETLQALVTQVTSTRSLHESRLKIIFRSVESDPESSFEVTTFRLHITEIFTKIF